jgi:menaquinone reductase, multiheme cytochrome c subunit
LDPRNKEQGLFVFPRWVNRLRELAAVAAVLVPVWVGLLIAYGFSPRTTAVGYQPVQPVPYSHAMHAGLMGMDCRYCHTTVEQAAYAAVPPTGTCMNCHQQVRKESPKLQPVRDSYASGLPVPWVKVHDLPDFVYFNHSAHVTRGVGCVSCHGRVDRMEVVTQEQPLSMAWCLQCHRQPERYLRPLDKVTAMDWRPTEDQLTLGRRLRQQYNINPSTDCSTCHR